MKVKVKLFSIIRIQVGTAVLEVDLPQGASIQDLLDYMEESYREQLKSVFKSKNGHYTFAVKLNGNDSDRGAALSEGDTVALLTPVCGG